MNRIISSASKQDDLLADARTVASSSYRALPAPELLEQAFLKATFEHRVKHFKLTIYLGLFLLAIYGFVDIYNLDESVKQVSFIRYGLIIPLAILATHYFQQEKFAKLQDWLICIAGVLICCLIFVIKYMSHEEGRLFYSSGFLIILAYINIVIQPRFWPSLFSSLFIYVVSLIFFFNIGYSDTKMLYLIFDATCMIFFSLMSNYFIQLQVRKNYAQRLLQEFAYDKVLFAQSRMKKMAHLDPLTGIANRRVFNNMLSEPMGSQTGLLFIDIDHFKAFNDYYGHTVGDQCISNVAEQINDSIRETDLCIRYGGEEFLVVMNNTDQKSVLKVANRIRESIQEKSIEHHKSPFKVITVSIGAAYEEHCETSLSIMVDKADDALYKSKQKGRNCISFY